MVYHKGKRDELTVKKQSVGIKKTAFVHTKNRICANDKIEFAKIENRICANKKQDLRK